MIVRLRLYDSTALSLTPGGQAFLAPRSFVDAGRYCRTVALVMIASREN